MKDTLKVIEKYFLIIIGLIAVIGIILVKDNLKDILMFTLKILKPLIGGCFISYLLYPFIKKLENKLKIKKSGIRRGISITIVYLIAGIILFSLISVCASPVSKSIKEIVDNAPGIYTTIENYINKDANSILFKTLNSGAFSETLKNTLTNIVPLITVWISGIIKSGTNFLIALVMSIYISFDVHNIEKNLKRASDAYLGNKATLKITYICNECDKVFHKFLIGKAIDSTIIGFLTFIILCVFNIKYSVLLAVVVGITNMIPYVGPFIGGFIGAIILLIISPDKAILFCVIILFIQQFDGHILGPKILSGKISIGPLWILLSVAIGGVLAGVTGMFLGPPTLATIVHLLDNDIKKRLENKPE